ncbi:hypothetical protein ACS0TY_021453 [Phlomoides rotata]
MEALTLQVLCMVLKLCVFASLLVIQGSSVPEGIPGDAPNTNVFSSNAPAPVTLPIGTGPSTMPPFRSAPAPQMTKGPLSPTGPTPSTSPPSLFSPPPAIIPDPVPFMPPVPSPGKPQHSEHPPSTVQTPAPVISPSSSPPPDEQTRAPDPVSMPPPISHKSKAPINSAPLSPIAPVSNVPAPRGIPESPPPSYSVLPNEPPSPPPDVSPRPALPGNSPPLKPIAIEPSSSPPDVSPHPALPGNSTPAKPIAVEPPSSPPVQNASPLLAPPPSISRTAFIPVAAPTNRTIHHYAPVSHSPTEAPSSRNTPGHSNSAPPPHLLSKSAEKKHHPKDYKISPAPQLPVIPPPSGSSASSPPIPSIDNSFSPTPAPSPAHHGQAKIPSPKISPSGPLKGTPKMPKRPPFQALPPPPPHKGCAPLTCIEPLAYGPPEAPCVCVLPIQVGLRLSVALYTFFPLVSELAAEIASGVFMKQSQVRVMGANADEDNTEKTVVLIDLLPLGERFDDTTAYLTFERFWRKQVVIKTSIFGDYDVLYVKYPGLPNSPPLPPSANGIIPSKPYPGHGSMQPLGVDISRNQHKHGLSGSILAAIILSCFVAVFLFFAVGWILIFRYRQRPFQLDPTPPTTTRSLAKSSGIPVSMTGSGVSSPSFSLGSSMAAYTGSAKTFSSSDIEKATNFFNETRVIGEGGFGRVYSGVLDDGTKVAIKILKRYDQQSGREFMAEVEMLSRLHHRNLVKLIGICVEERTRCLVYELIPNGSVESHLHGIDKERSPLDWGARLKIALGAARALAYLHEDSCPRVIHRDFKASNILLEDDFTPKVSDFGLARAALDEASKHISTRVMGTFGYVAPEYAMTGHLLVKSDVYSYGVVLLELLTGKKPVDMSQPPGQENLVSLVRPLLTSREGLEMIIDQTVAPNISFDSIAKVAAIASMCVQPEVSHRPFMGEVVQALKLIYSECDEVKELEGRKSINTDPIPAGLLSPSTVSDYDYRVDLEGDLSMSELLSSRFEKQDSESFRRYSSSGPLGGGGNTKPLWKTMRWGSVSEHGVLFRLWPGSD